MSNTKAVLYSIGVTAVSMTALTFHHGLPTISQFVGGGVVMVAVAFVAFKCVGRYL